MTKNQKILNLAVSAGEILIQSGGEISRVETTMRHIIEAYDIQNYNIYILSNGIFSTIESTEDSPYCLVRHVKFGTVNLEQIAAVNQLSREICQYHYSPELALEKMEVCRNLQTHPLWEKSLASGSGCAAFTLLLGGSLTDSLTAFCFGGLLQPLLYYFRVREFSRFFYTIAASAFITLLTVLSHTLSLPIRIDMVIIGCIMPLVPGLTLTNSIRDFFNADYLSGVIHMVDALLTALSIAVGVGLVMTFYQFFGGNLG